MAEEKPSEDSVFERIKTLMTETVNEVLDAREAKAADAEKEKEKDDSAPEPKRTTEKPSIMQTLFGG